MDINQIVEWVIAVIPSIIAVLSTVGLIWKVIKYFKKLIENFKNLKDDVSNMTAMEDIRNQLKEVLQENAKLKKQLNETLTKIDKVHRE